MENTKAHWETVYGTKTPSEVSWTQQVPQTSLDLIRSIENYREKHIVDVGAGDSTLVDFLIADGCRNISVLDISAKAIARAQVRLGEKASMVNWIVSDVVDFEPDQNIDIWHDRAAFHFLTDAEQVNRYASIVNRSGANDLILATFSTDGPEKCSGLKVSQYDTNALAAIFQGFDMISCRFEDHLTQFDTVQNFIFCSFSKKPGFSIKTNRLEIRNMRPEDSDDFYLYRSNPEIVKFQSFDVMDRDQAARFIENQSQKRFGTLGEWVQYSIVETATSRLVGDCAIKLDAYDARMAEIGITLSHLHQRKGFAREALSGVIDFLFSLPDFHRIVELVDTRNVASIKMLEVCGFRREGHFVQSYFENGGWTDEYQYAMLREDRECIKVEPN